MADEPKVIEIDSYEPDYDSTCDCCGQSPVVTAVKDGVVVHSTEMCGVCTFGTARAMDPEWWNSDDD